MSKQDEFPFKVTIEAGIDERFNKNFIATLQKQRNNTDRMSIDVEERDKKLFINIKSKDINTIRSAANNCMQSLNTLSEVDKL